MSNSTQTSNDEAATRIIGPLKVDTVDLLPGHFTIVRVYDTGDPKERAVSIIGGQAYKLLMEWQQKMLKKYPRGRFTTAWSLDGAQDATRMLFTTFASVSAAEEAAWRKIMDKPLWTLKVHKKVLTPRRAWMIGIDDTVDSGFMPLDNSRAQRVLGRWLMKMRLLYPNGCITSISSGDDVLDPYRFVFNTND